MPVPHRSKSSAAKERRSASWKRGEDRKAARRKAQTEAARHNRLSQPTPWQRAKAARRDKRAQKREVFELKQKLKDQEEFKVGKDQKITTIKTNDVL
jgi:hypothetical protein